MAVLRGNRQPLGLSRGHSITGALGAKVELVEENALGKVALIRDPLGAGFTCYQGELPSALETGPSGGRWVGSELFISDFSKIEPFYTELFGWRLIPRGENQWTIQTRDGVAMGTIHQATEEEKGDKEYWAVFFQVADIEAATRNIESAGGEVIKKESQLAMAYDSQGAYFGLKSGAESSSPNTEMKEPIKWRSLVGLALLYPAILLEINFIWGLFFLFWIIPDLKSGATYFMERVSRRENPALYWTIVVTWLLLSGLMLVM